MTKHNGERTRDVPSIAAWWVHRRLVLSLVLCLVMALVAVVALRIYGPGNVQDLLSLSRVASPTASPASAPHKIYAFSFDILPRHSAEPMLLHVGQPVTFQWTPDPALLAPNEGYAPTANRPFPVHCTLALYGPYPSMDDLTKATNTPGTDGIAPSGTPAFTTPPLNMTDWDTTSHQVEFALPTTLHVGYYQTDSECLYDRDQSTSGIGFPIQIDA